MKITNLLAEFLNYVSSGGSKYQKGFISPTADEIEFFIGQFTGGAGREVMKASVATKALISGDELPPYKVPLAGKLLGNAGSPASISNQFYENVRDLSQVEHEIEGRRANRENAEGYRAKHPEASLITTANRLEVEINQINKDIRDLTGKPGKDAQIKRLRDQKTRMMKQFNDRYRSLTK